MAKYVVQDHVPGALLPDVSGEDTVWNWHPELGKCWWEQETPHA